MSQPQSFGRTLWQTLARNPISFFAVLCVAACSIYLGILVDRLLDVLTSETWCGKSIQAEKISPGTSFAGLISCIDMLKIQLQSLATGFLIAIGGFVFGNLVLVIVVIAGARASGKVGTTGLEFGVGKDTAIEGAAHVEEAAHQAADEVKKGAPE